MDSAQQTSIIERIIDGVEKRIPQYLANPVDLKITNGNLAICIIDGSGRIHARMFGTDKIALRRTYGIAWTKASQVWITRIATGQYEKMVFSGEIDPNQFGIQHPDFIGWEGGQPIDLDDTTWIAAGFSGIRGIYDLEIVRKAADEVLGK